MAGIIGNRSSSSDGLIIITGEAGFRQMDSKLCPHCGGHFIIIPGSGRLRNFCQMCGVPTCDKLKCIEHSPFEKRLDLVEAGKLPLRAL